MLLLSVVSQGGRFSLLYGFFCAARLERFESRRQLYSREVLTRKTVQLSCTQGLMWPAIANAWMAIDINHLPSFVHYYAPLMTNNCTCKPMEFWLPLESVLR